MEIKEVNLKRLVPKEGMALKWKERYWNSLEEKFEEYPTLSLNSVMIDLDNIVGEVEEITMEQYKEEIKSCEIALRGF